MEDDMGGKADQGIPMPALRRLPVYYRRVRQAIETGAPFVSSEELGQSAGVPGVQVRKDLSYLSEYGRPGIGYDAPGLAADLEDFLGLMNDKEAVLAGVGNLGRALALYNGFAHYGLQIIAAFDNDPARQCELPNGRQVFPIEKLTNLVGRLQVKIGIITVPPEAAQAIADAMVAGGIKVIWNFAPCRLKVPDDVLVKNEDLAAELATLSYQITRRKMAHRES
jgi:redox-sensing transcriptional repressor